MMHPSWFSLNIFHALILYFDALCRCSALFAVAKTRLQTLKKGEGEKNYKGIADCLMLVM